MSAAVAAAAASSVQSPAAAAAAAAVSTAAAVAAMAASSGGGNTAAGGVTSVANIKKEGGGGHLGNLSNSSMGLVNAGHHLHGLAALGLPDDGENIFLILFLFYYSIFMLEMQIPSKRVLGQSKPYAIIETILS